jgi:PTH1 family peptidyl-tRNA hydrolase
MKLIIGLGNIGKEYNQTRHNIGFMCVDEFASKHNLRERTTHNYGYISYKNCLLIKPRTYMNNSGIAYGSAIKKYGPFEDVLVISDDIELPIGKIRVRNSGGDGGHNGLKSIIEHAGTNEIRRIRIGIGRSENQNAREHVLDKFNKTELPVINNVISLVAGWLDTYIESDMESLLNEYSKWMKKPIPSPEDGIDRPKEDNE